MTRLEKNIKKKNSIIFDLDGVLINSKKNMALSWNFVNKKFNLNISFTQYQKHVGLGFQNILNNLGINNNLKLIEKIYKEQSLKNINKIILFPKTLNTLKILNSNYNFSIFTSKEKKRTNLIIKKYFKNFKFLFIQSPNIKFKTKPNPKLLNKNIKDNHINKKNCVYIGDTFADKKLAKNTKIKFIYANYGGFSKNIQYINRIDSISELPRIVTKIFKK